MLYAKRSSEPHRQTSTGTLLCRHCYSSLHRCGLPVSSELPASRSIDDATFRSHNIRTSTSASECCTINNVVDVFGVPCEGQAHICAMRTTIQHVRSTAFGECDTPFGGFTIPDKNGCFSGVGPLQRRCVILSIALWTVTTHPVMACASQTSTSNSTMILYCCTNVLLYGIHPYGDTAINSNALLIYIYMFDLSSALESST